MKGRHAPAFSELWNSSDFVMMAITHTSRWRLSADGPAFGGGLVGELRVSPLDPLPALTSFAVGRIVSL